MIKRFKPISKMTKEEKEEYLKWAEGEIIEWKWKKFIKKLKKRK